MAYKIVKGGYPDLNREQAVPHTVTLPLSYIHLYYIQLMKTKKKSLKQYYVGVARTLNRKYQKFMTYQLVHNILDYKQTLNFKIVKVNPT